MKAASVVRHSRSGARRTRLLPKTKIPVLFLILGVLAALVSPGVAAYERATAPPPPDIEGAAGSTGSIEVAVQIPATPRRLDLEILLDLSGSYGDDLPNMQELLPRLLGTLATETDLRVGLATFVDDPCCGGAPSDYPYLRHVDLTQDIERVSLELGKLTVREGGDTPESWLHAINEIVTASSYNGDSTRVLVVATDAPSHSVADGSGSVAPTASTVSRDLASAGVRLIAVTPDEPSSDLQLLVTATNGSVQRGSRSSDDFEAVVLRGLKEVLVSVTPMLVGLCPIETITFDPPTVRDIRGGSRIVFTAQYRIASDALPGDHDCVLDLGEAGPQVIELWVTD